jgi:hypothetical protein
MLVETIKFYGITKKVKISMEPLFKQNTPSHAFLISIFYFA